MAEYTRQIQQLRQQASQTPQFQAPSQSLGGDIVNAVGTGLQFFQQQQAQQKLEGLVQAEQQELAAQKDYEARVAKAAMDMGNFMLEAEANNLSPVQFQQLRKKRLSSLGDSSFQADVVAAQRKLTGNSAFTTQRGLQTKEDKELAAQRAREEALVALRQEAGIAAAKAGLSTAKIDSMTEEQLIDLRLQGKVLQAEEERDVTQLAQKIKRGEFEKMTKEQQTSEYINATVPTFASGLSSNVNTLIDSLGGVNATNKNALLDAIDQQRRGLPDVIATQVETARNLGHTLTLEQQKAFETKAQAIFDDMEKMIVDETGSRALDNLYKRDLGEAIVLGLSSEDDDTRTAALTLGFKLGTGEQLQVQDIANTYKLMAKAKKGEAPPSTLDAEQTKSVIVGANAKTEGDEYSPEVQEMNFDIYTNFLDGTAKNKKAAIENSALPIIARQVAASEGKNIPPAKHREMADILYREASSNIAASIAAAVNVKKGRFVEARSGVGGKAELQIAPSGAEGNFTLDPNTLKLVIINPAAVEDKNITKYDNYITDVLKSLEYLGGDIKKFKEDVLSSALITSN